MMTPLARSILIWARVIELRRLAGAQPRKPGARPTRQENRRADDIELPLRHRQLRQMLLGIARGDRDSQSPKLLPPPSKGE
jgi:hypothetical protein